jgi:hypothetical protein
MRAVNSKADFVRIEILQVQRAPDLILADAAKRRAVDRSADPHP